MAFVSMWLAITAGFLIIVLASRQIGSSFARLRLPLISGFLCTGILAGPYVLALIPASAIDRLRFVDEIALAFIAFAAGSELFVRQLRNRLKSIRYTTACLVAGTFCLGSLGFFLLSEVIPFARQMPASHRAAIALLAGAILVARSPSSAIAVVNELRAKGPFTRTVLGVTVIMDVVVIALFSICTSIAGTILAGDRFDQRFLLILVAELSAALVMAYLLSKLLRIILARRMPRQAKTFLILGAGYTTFVLSSSIRHWTQSHIDIELLLEPLLVCMLAGFFTINYSEYRTEFRKVLHDIAPYVYVAFFTLTGASLALDVLVDAWLIALSLFGVRIIGVFLGSFTGGVLSREPMRFNRISGMAYITQAGVGLGLAKDVAVEFPHWGATFATMIIAVIVLNQLVGPPLFKWALFLAREAHPRTEGQSGDTIRDAVIFGLESDSLALARLLQSNGWEVRIATRQSDGIEKLGDEAEIEIHSIPALDVNALKRLGVGQADAVVAMLSDEENYRICALADEHFATRNVVVRLNQRRLLKRFHEIGARVVEPATAIVNLLDQFVRSPSTASLLLGLEKGRDIIEFEMRNQDFHGIAIRELNLPLDIHILSLRRNEQLVVCGGFTTLEKGDWLTVVGSRPSLEQMMLQFGEDRQQALVHLVEQVTAARISSNDLNSELSEIMNKNDDKRSLRFNRLVEHSVVLDLEEPLDYQELFRLVAQELSTKVNISPENLFEELTAREKESSTALRPDLAIPHIIIDGDNSFCILLARCRKGIHFSELAPRVNAVFVLAGNRGERDFHLYALSAIARIVQRSNFREKWRQAKNETALRNIAMT